MIAFDRLRLTIRFDAARAKENLLLYKERLRVDALPGPHHNSITNLNTMFTILNI
jgi:hypothetical protein